MAASDWQEKTASSSRSAQPVVHDAGLGLGHEAWNESVPAAGSLKILKCVWWGMRLRMCDILRWTHPLEYQRLRSLFLFFLSFFAHPPPSAVTGRCACGVAETFFFLIYREADNLRA